VAETEQRLAKSRAALEALETALKRLEKAYAGRKGEQALSADLAAARADYDRLATAARTVESRLDGVRERLRAVLGN
jgi:ATP/maltotriose-dependent transcriptional regulator MalT